MFLENIEGKWKCISVNAKCDECGAEYKAKISTALKQQQIVGHHQCRKCSSRRAGKKTGEKMREIYSQLYSGEGNFSKKPGVGEKISAAKKGIPLTEEQKAALRKPKTITEKFIKAMQNEDLRKTRSDRMKKNNPVMDLKVREKISNTISKKYANGEIENLYKKFKTGWFDSNKTLKPIYYRSGLERSFLELIDSCEWIYTIESAENIKIKYLLNGVQHNYLPDFKIVFDDKSCIIVEIKSTYFQNMPNWEYKLEALRKFCELTQINYIILTEKEEKEWLELLKEKKQVKAQKPGI